MPTHAPEMLHFSLAVQQKEGGGSAVGPFVLAFLLIVVIGSSVVQVYQSAKQGF